VRLRRRSTGKIASLFEELPMARWTVLALSLLAAYPSSAKAAGDPAAGEKVFLKCRACHQIGETAKNAVGPKLNGLLGRHSGSVEGYSYSPANKNSGLTWDEPTFRDYIKAPQTKITGTKMVFPGLKSETEIDDIIAFLKQFDADGKKQ
jgi:cytochrome c